MLADLPSPAHSSKARVSLADATGVVNLGSYGANPGGSASLILAGTDSAWQSLQDRFAALRRQFPLSGFRLPGPDTTVRWNSDNVVVGEDGRWGWEATLHPEPDSPVGTPASPVSFARLRAFADAAERAGGTAVINKAVAAGSLTYLPVLLPPGPASAVILGGYNPLRSLRPAARIGYR